MKKILYVTTISNTINAFLVPHILMLKKEGFQVDCACSIVKPISKELIENGVKIYDIPFSRNPMSYNNLRSIFYIKKLQKQNGYDIVNVNTPNAAFITRFALRKYNDINMVYTCHGFHFYKGAPLINWIVYYPLEKIAARWTNYIITINSEDYEHARALKNDTQSVYRINGIGVDLKKYKTDNLIGNKIKRELGFKDEDFIITSIGELNTNKNQKQLITALSKIENSNIKLVFVGIGKKDNYLKEMVYQKQLTNRVKFLGYRNDITEIINMSDIIALVSKREGLPRCLLEGLAIGKPLLATTTRGGNELVDNGQNGYLIPIDDYQKTAEAILNIYNIKDLSFMKIKSKEKSIKYDLNAVLNEVKNIMKIIDK